MRVERGLVAGLMGAWAVAMGAFGAHGLQGHVPADRLAVWETGARYHLVHAVVLLVLSARSGEADRWPWSSRLLLAGTLVFAGSLYALVLLDQPLFGAVTPIGGVLLIAGWIAIAREARVAGRPPQTP